MEFESSSIDSSWLSGSQEAPKEKSEKQSESYKKAQAQLQKAKKDEKKAQWDNDALFNILLRFIQNPFYEEFIPTITELLSHAVPSRFIISTISLIYPEAALHILTHLERKDDIHMFLELHRYEHMIDLNEHTLHPTLRTWMSTWSHMTQQYLLDSEGSVVMQQKLFTIIQQDSNSLMSTSLAQSIRFFFHSRNVKITEKVSISYADFILKEYIKTLKNTLSSADEDLISSESSFDSSRLFWLSS